MAPRGAGAYGRDESYEPPAKASRLAGGARPNTQPVRRNGGAAAPSAPLSAAEAALKRAAAEKERRMTVKKRLAEVSALVDSLTAAVVASTPSDRASSGALASAPPPDPPTMQQEQQAGPAWGSDNALATKLEASKTKRIQDILARPALAAVRHLMAHKWAWPFNEPVDPLKMGLLDYTSVVTQPMDLGTVKARLEACYYSHPDQAACDVRLVFANARRYNAAGTDVHIMACTLLEAFEGKWAATVAVKLADAATQSAVEEEKARARHAAVAAARVNDAAERRCCELEKRLAGAEAALADARASLAALSPPLTAEERRLLANGLRDCHPSALPGAVALVAAAAGVAAGDVPDTVDVDLEGGDKLMLRRLLSYVSKAPKKPAAQEKERARAAAAAAAAEKQPSRHANAGGRSRAGGARHGGGADERRKRARPARKGEGPDASTGATTTAPSGTQMPPGFDDDADMMQVVDQADPPADAGHLAALPTAFDGPPAMPLGEGGAVAPGEGASLEADGDVATPMDEA